MLLHRVDEHRAGDRTAERGGVEVRPAAGRDVERAALQRDETLVDELGAAVDQERLLGAVGLRPVGNPGDVVFVVLAEIGRERVRNPAFLPDPGDRDGRVEPS